MWRHCLVVAALLAGCSTSRNRPSDSVSAQQLARVPPDQMGPVNNSRLELLKAKDEVARRELAVKSAQSEMEVANTEVKVANSQIDKFNAILSKANFDRNSEAGREAQSELVLSQAQLETAKAHVNAAGAAARLADGQKRQAESEQDLAQARLELVEAQALKASGDPAGNSVNTDAIRARVDDRLKQVEQARSDLARLQEQAERERTAWQVATRHLNQMRGTGAAGR